MPLTVQRQSSFAPILPAYTPQFFSYPSLIFSPVVVTPNVHNFPSLIRPSSIALIMRPPMISGSESGFTLVEIVVVVVIISIFAGMISLSVGSSESRKNHAFYEHLTDSLNYVRLLSAERMQPMGLSLQADKQGQVTPVIMTLSNPYAHYQTPIQTDDNKDSVPKNAMELSTDISGLSELSGIAAGQVPIPSWEREMDVTLPELPAGVSLNIQSLEASSGSNGMNSASDVQVLQPWFTGQAVPQVLWFGTGQAAPVTIEVRHQSRLVGEVITIMPDGSIITGQGQ